jgi:hypothetical protein
MKRFMRLVAGIGAVISVALLPANAQADEPLLFNAELSLTGDCSESALDPVPDPGLCPTPPGVLGVDHPSDPFSRPRTVTTDEHGNIYVTVNKAGEGRIDIFTSAGSFISELRSPAAPSIEPTEFGNIAVDSEGYLYIVATELVKNSGSVSHLYRYKPTIYEPAKEKVQYSDPPVEPLGEVEAARTGLAINRANDHLFYYEGGRTEPQGTPVGAWAIREFTSAKEGNTFVEEFGHSQIYNSRFSDNSGLAVDAAHGRIYASAFKRVQPGSDEVEAVVIGFELAAPHQPLVTIEGSDLPTGEFSINTPYHPVAVNEATGHVYVWEGTKPAVYEFDQEGNYVSTIEHSFKEPPDYSGITVDNGLQSPNGAANRQGRALFVPSNPLGLGHLYAFTPKPVAKAPVVESLAVSGVTQTEAVFGARVNPQGVSATYTFEYTTEQRFKEQGFLGAAIAGTGTVGPSLEAVSVSAAGVGLAPGTAYRFRVVAESSQGADENEATFVTFGEADKSEGCPNESVRGGLSAALPDCRAYELVTPPDTNGHPPIGQSTLGIYFSSREAAPDGNAVSFQIQGGAIPGLGGTGALGGDPYLSRREPSGWSTVSAGPNGFESAALVPGSPSPDQGYSFWSTGGQHGSAAIDEETSSYLHYPDGHSELIGRGDLGIDPQAQGLLIAPAGRHVIFSSGVQLENGAPEVTENALYDRTIDPESGEEVTHVVSLLPGGETPPNGEKATYRGASLDGRGVAFTLATPKGEALFLRYRNEETFEVATGAKYEGIAEGGNRVFYLEGGDLKRLDVTNSERLAFTEGAGVEPVSISADGSTAYFLSSVELDVAPNPEGSTPTAGASNLYRSREGALSFVGTVDETDASSLSKWTGFSNQIAADPSRATPDGQVFVFESHVKLTEADPGGQVEIYRYDAAAPSLACISCNRTGAAARSARLQSFSRDLFDNTPLNQFASAVNLASDGRRTFFESDDRLVPADNDGLQDVYEWEQNGAGSCQTAQGCIYLISSGESAEANYLFGMSDDGRDVFIVTSDLLVPSRDPNATPSIYDARENGGFPTPPSPPGECLGESCQPASVAPEALRPASSTFVGAGNVKQQQDKGSCSRGVKSKSMRRGRRSCRHRHTRHHHTRHKAHPRRTANGRSYR